MTISSATNFIEFVIPENQIKGVLGLIGRIRELGNHFIEQELADAGIRGILPAHGIILHYLFQQNGPVPMKDIVEQVGRVKSTVTGMISTLEQHGYAKKKQSPEDGRIMLVQLTDQGKALRPVFETISDRLLERVYGDMPMEDRKTMVRLLTEVKVNLE